MTDDPFSLLHSKLTHVIKKNKDQLRSQTSQLAKGTISEQEFLIFLISELTRIQAEFFGYTKIFFKRYGHLQTTDLIEDNLTKAAIIETLFEMIPPSAQSPTLVNIKKTTSPPASPLQSTSPLQ